MIISLEKRQNTPFFKLNLSVNTGFFLNNCIDKFYETAIVRDYLAMN